MTYSIVNCILNCHNILFIVIIRACYDITIGAPLTTGVTEVETAAKPVETRYYDLSGRSISANTNGVNIRVDKYADGTCRTVKSVR